MMLLESLAQASFTMLKQANRRHDVVAVQITDRYELELPALGRLVLKDAETGEVLELNTADPRVQQAFTTGATGRLAQLRHLFRQARLDAIEVQTDQPYLKALIQFFDTRNRRLHP